jgi:CTP:molybdopterin cytidylyltransferase MocA
MPSTRIFPIILAAGGPGALQFPKPLARFGDRTAVELAIENCTGLEPPIVVLGYHAAEVRRALPRGTRYAFNAKWRKGQLTSLLTGLRRIPRDAAFLLYPVDQPLLTQRLISALARAFAARKPHQKIVMPRAGQRAGHPILCHSDLRVELRVAKTAREVVYRDHARVKYVAVSDSAIWRDYDSLSSYRRCQRLYLRRASINPAMDGARSSEAEVQQPARVAIAP